MKCWYKKKETKLTTNKAVTIKVVIIVIIIIIIIIIITILVIIIIIIIIIISNLFRLFIEFETLIHFTHKRFRIISSVYHLREQIQKRTLGVQCK